jgi:hypothetical protein
MNWPSRGTTRETMPSTDNMEAKKARWRALGHCVKSKSVSLADAIGFFEQASLPKKRKILGLMKDAAHDISVCLSASGFALMPRP